MPSPHVHHLTPITCQQSVQFVSLLRDNELSQTDLARLEAHVQSCPRCQTARQQFEILHTGLDTLLSRPAAVSVAHTSPTTHPATTNPPRANRRQWLAWLTGTGMGALAGTGAGIWWTSAALQTAQTSDDAVAHRIAQYQALYVRETVQDGALSERQAQAVLMQWSQQAAQASHIQTAPDLDAFGLRLVRAQRLALNGQPILQWVYLPAQGQPVALCGMARPDAHSAAAQMQPSPPLFSASGMRGTHWQHRNVLWVLVAPQDTWPSQRFTQLRENIAQQLA
ncbi:zf-HC2 domain-containing protein [Limnohabitans sp.]|uniref:zf-HC2 domain-containing protein n=1 Tax=Limnohabitans sp. TaxID=1907725 RepID=UPI00286F0641|nr:zf-HC2 domain-containing protein [Limnohabitans sp.]